MKNIKIQLLLVTVVYYLISSANGSFNTFNWTNASNALLGTFIIVVIGITLIFRYLDEKP